MPVLNAIDFEATGLDTQQDHVIEVGSILYSTGQKKCLESQGYLVKTDKLISEEITKLTGITQAACDRFGYSSTDALDTVLDLAAQSDAFIGQNVIQYDKRMMESWCKREGREMPIKLWIDTRTDLIQTTGKHLQYMCADNFFLNLFPHSAMSDCQSVLKLLDKEDINKVIERAQSPTVVLISHQPREDNELAKKRKFRWSGDYRIWWKAVKEMDIEEEVKAASFNISKAPPEVLLEKLWYQ